ncbi:MAG: sulfotransferase family 2 domain-containing protein [Leptolyngbya sp. SIO1D8]|nr:sulfotransferase family 2 domain-containing protein [Leptolyngbya sp. SIO1D8]
MIISHKYKFIFLKTRKTAGTSIEIALSQFCGAKDVITPIVGADERKRRELGFRGPQNYNIPLSFYQKSDWLTLLRERKPKQFFNHAGAVFIRDNIGQDIWNSYFKFCFERDPFDKAISRYYWNTREPRPEISNFLEATQIKFLSDWQIYTIDNQIVADFVGRYENLADDLAIVAEKIGLSGELSLPKAKGGYRKDRKHYSQVLDERARARIEQVCSREMANFKYTWPAS